MKKHWLPIAFAALLVLAPSAHAADGAGLSLEGLFDQIVALLVGDEASPDAAAAGDAVTSEEPEGGFYWPPGG